jgi:NAD dependent epimerase/dehydratase
MTWKSKNVLVTGAGGFIGSHLTEKLASEGASVRALVHYNALGSIGNLRFLEPSLLRSVEVVAGDICDPHAVRSYVRGMEVVFHLAALIGIPYSYTAPASYVSANIIGTTNILEATRSETIQRVIVTSTSETYGTAQYKPMDEKHPAVAQSPYAATKIAADQIALSYWRSFGLPVAVVRPFNTFGPRQSERAIIPTIVSQALFNHGVVRLGSLLPRRDLTYVADTVDGFLVIADRLQAVGSAVNLGTGLSRSVREMVEVVGNVLGLPLDIVEDHDRIRPERSEVLDLCADASLARGMGWNPRFTLAAGVEAVVQFLKERGPGTDYTPLGYRT